MNIKDFQACKTGHINQDALVLEGCIDKPCLLSIAMNTYVMVYINAHISI